MSAPSAAPHRHIAPFDGVRAVAVSLVLLDHAFGSPSIRLTGLRAGEIPVGSMGVLVFFVLSGLLITGLLRDELARTGDVSLRGFYWRRSLRILPPVVVFLGVLALSTAMGWWTAPTASQWIHLLTWTVNYSKPPAEASHLWSLSVEEQFYFVWPVLFLVLGVARARKVLVVLLLLPPLIRVGAWSVSQAFGEAMWHRMEGVVDALAAGSLVALLAGALTNSARYQRWLSSAWPAWLPLLAVAGSLTTLWARLWSVAGQSIVVAASVLYLDWLQRRPDTQSARVLSLAPAQWFGRISYGVYVYHLPIFAHVLRGHPWVQIALAIAVGHVSYHTLEAYARRWRAHVTGRPAAQHQPLPS
jgi:peptidoglycan/LPS O-acetylase OafA/YrhL